jgi:hypothetical protein
VLSSTVAARQPILSSTDLQGRRRYAAKRSAVTTSCLRIRYPHVTVDRSDRGVGAVLNAEVVPGLVGVRWRSPA